jgi:hypothetical protein
MTMTMTIGLNPMLLGTSLHRSRWDRSRRLMARWQQRASGDMRRAMRQLHLLLLLLLLLIDIPNPDNNTYTCAGVVGRKGGGGRRIGICTVDERTKFPTAFVGQAGGGGGGGGGGGVAGRGARGRPPRFRHFGRD